jgi:hypothetical protein
MRRGIGEIERDLKPTLKSERNLTLTYIGIR